MPEAEAAAKAVPGTVAEAAVAEAAVEADADVDGTSSCPFEAIFSLISSFSNWSYKLENELT